MKPKVYKSKYQDITKLEGDLLESGYEKQGNTMKVHDEMVELSFFLESHPKGLPNWIVELVSLFSIEKEIDINANQYNAIVVISTEKSIYLVPQGYGFWAAEKLADLNFGMDFAERALKEENISVKAVSYIQRNKMRGVTNYKKGQNEFPQASESFLSVSGIPTHERVYGKNIDCGLGVDFSKNYKLDSKDPTVKQNSLLAFCRLFNEIDITNDLKKNSSIPRLQKLKKSSSLHRELNDELLRIIQSDSYEAELMIDINRIQLIGNKLEIMISSDKLSVYIDKGEKIKQQTKQFIELDESEIKKYIKTNSSVIKSLDDVKFELYDEADEIISKNAKFSQIIHCEVEYKGTVYLLQNGYWGYLNDKFFELLHKKISEINEIVHFNDEFNIQYISADKGELCGEGGYIEEVCKKKDSIKLHKRNVNVSGLGVEIADIYSKSKDELFAIKRGTKTGLAIYSFEQTILSMQALANRKSFNVFNELVKYNDSSKYDSEKYPHISEELVKKIVESKKISVLWLIEDSPKFAKEGVAKKRIDLNDFTSILLKLKIVDWYSFSRECGYDPKLYFALDKPTLNP